MTSKEFTLFFEKLQALPALREDTCIDSLVIFKTVEYQNVLYLISKSYNSVYLKSIYVGYFISKKNPKIKKLRLNAPFKYIMNFKNGTDVFVSHSLNGPALMIDERSGPRMKYIIHGEFATNENAIKEYQKEQNKQSLKKKLSTL